MSGLIRLDILDSLEGILNATIFKLVYYIEYGLCWIISILSQLFGVFAGTARIEYNERYDYLINIFFSNRVISNIYWAMALIGIALTMGFTIWSVIRKMFDASGKVQQSLGQIITRPPSCEADASTVMTSGSRMASMTTSTSSRAVSAPVGQCVMH